MGFQGANGGQLADNPVELGNGGWNNVTLIGPGTANGQVTIWARDNATGALYDYPISINPGTGNPTLNPVSPGTLVTPDTVPTGSGAFQISGISLPAATYPVVAALGDDATAATPGLYVIDSSGNVWEYQGTSGISSPGSGTASPLSATRTSLGTVPAGSITQLS